MKHFFKKDYLVKRHSQRAINKLPISSANLGKLSHVNNKYGLSICIVQNSKQLDAFNAFNDVSIDTRYFIFTYEPNEDDKQNANWFGNGYFVVIPKNVIRISVVVEETTWDTLIVCNNHKQVINEKRANKTNNHQKKEIKKVLKPIIEVDQSAQEKEDVVNDSSE